MAEVFRRGAAGALFFDVGEKSCDEAGVELGPMTFVDGDFGGTEEICGALDLTNYAFAEAGTNVASVFRL